MIIIVRLRQSPLVQLSRRCAVVCRVSVIEVMKHLRFDERTVDLSFSYKILTRRRQARAEQLLTRSEPIGVFGHVPQPRSKLDQPRVASVHTFTKEDARAAVNG